VTCYESSGTLTLNTG